MLINIIRHWDDHPPVVLGQVEAEFETLEEARTVIEEAWELFDQSERDADSEFLAFLQNYQPTRFQASHDEAFDVAVGP